MESTLVVKQMDIKNIRPYENNPRKNDKGVDTVADSIQQYGWQQPIVVDKNMVIIVGHTRFRAAKKLGLSNVPVSIAQDLTAEQVNAYRIMDNRSNENSFWDDAKLFEELNALIKDGNKAELSFETGFSEAQLNKLFKDTTDPIDSFNLSQTSRSKKDDLWILGNHRLLNGDSTSAVDVKRVLQDDKIDLLWEDPPYGISYQTISGINHSKEYNEAKNHKIANDNLKSDELDIFLDKHMEVVINYIRPGSGVYWCHDIRFTHQFKSILEKHNFHISDTLIWKKDQHSSFLADYAKFYEPILYGWKKGKDHNWYGNIWNPNVTDLSKLEDMTKEQLIKMIKSINTNYQEFSKEKKAVAKLHPTVKPVKLIVYHIYNSTKLNDVVYDGFAGSGSTLLAAETTQRRARCIEYEPKFIDVIIRRWQEQTGLQAVREDGMLWDDIDKNIYDQNLVDDNLAEMFQLGAENDREA
jgi:site-specific DNA-methyltransferase (adenine-specific)